MHATDSVLTEQCVAGVSGGMDRGFYVRVHVHIAVASGLNIAFFPAISLLSRAMASHYAH